MLSLLLPPWTPAEEALAAVLFLGYLLAVAAVPRVLLEKRESAATLAWLLAIVFLPYLGLALYGLMGTRRIRRYRRARARADRLLAVTVGERAAEALGGVPAEDTTRSCGVAIESSRLADRITGTAMLAGNRLDLLLDGDATYAAIEQAVRAARDHVHLLYYIFRADRVGRRILDLLVEKCKAGVEVRLLYDHVGSFDLDERDLAGLHAAGGRTAAFLPVNPISQRVNVTLRNHRKIVVVDGKVGFTGGINVGEEYRGGGHRRGRWRDSHVRMEGPAVIRLQEIFVEDWHFASGEDLVRARYFPRPRVAGPEVVRVVASGPDLRWETIHHILFTAITRAERRVFIATPYFVPDPAMEVALQTAALRGVDVRVLVPRRSDSRLLDLTAQSFVPDLVGAGVRVFRYGPGMMHAKTAVVDGEWSTIGSANMDIRSFRLNFEANLVVHGSDFARRLEASFLADLASAEELTRDGLRRRTRGMRMAEAACRVLAPIL